MPWVWRVWELRVLVLFRARPIFYRVIRYRDVLGGRVPGGPVVPEILYLIREVSVEWGPLGVPAGLPRFRHIYGEEEAQTVISLLDWNDLQSQVRVLRAAVPLPADYYGIEERVALPHPNDFGGEDDARLARRGREAIADGPEGEEGG
jgi:hypothetical protein